MRGILVLPVASKLVTPYPTEPLLPPFTNRRTADFLVTGVWIKSQVPDKTHPAFSRPGSWQTGWGKGTGLPQACSWQLSHLKVEPKDVKTDAILRVGGARDLRLCSGNRQTPSPKPDTVTRKCQPQLCHGQCVRTALQWGHGLILESQAETSKPVRKYGIQDVGVHITLLLALRPGTHSLSTAASPSKRDDLRLPQRALRIRGCGVCLIMLYTRYSPRKTNAIPILNSNDH